MIVEELIVAEPPAPERAPAPEVIEPDTSSCDIKGNISTDDDEKIYHMPGQRFYDKTKIDRPGERMFCSVAEAEAAGWRAAKV